jgi:hypothetical protein
VSKIASLGAIKTESLSFGREPIVNATNMLEFCKKVLLRVSHNRESFARELGKAVRSLKPIEIKQLKAWCRVQFAPAYSDIIHRAFAAY